MGDEEEPDWGQGVKEWSTGQFAGEFLEGCGGECWTGHRLGVRSASNELRERVTLLCLAHEFLSQSTRRARWCLI